MIAPYIIAGIIPAFFLLRFYMIIKMRLKKGKPAPDLPGKPGKAIKSGKKALFYFYSPQCGACRPMTPIMEKLSKRNKNVFRINIAQDMTTAKGFGIMGTPSTVLVEEGKIVEFLVGPKSEPEITALLA